LAVLLSERFAAAAGRAAVAAPSPAGARGLRRLPVSTTVLLGRERAIDEVAGLVERPDVRLVTLTGPGGVGKTRLAVAVGDRLRDRFGAGVVFVPLEAVTDADVVLAAIGRAVGADLPRKGSPLEALTETFGYGTWLLILDNLEQVDQARPCTSRPARSTTGGTTGMRRRAPSSRCVRDAGLSSRSAPSGDSQSTA
jgi:hypothetical protein